MCAIKEEILSRIYGIWKELGVGLGRIPAESGENLGTQVDAGGGCGIMVHGRSRDMGYDRTGGIGGVMIRVSPLWLHVHGY